MSPKIGSFVSEGDARIQEEGEFLKAHFRKCKFDAFKIEI